METKGIIFDLGGVVFNYSFDNAFKIWAQEIGVSYETIKSNFKFTSDFEKFERNDISSSQFNEALSKQLNSRLNHANFEKGWNSIYKDIIPNIDNLLIQLKQNYRLVALTNTNITHAKVWFDKYRDVLSHFEKIFTSYDIRSRKPESKAFKTVLTYLNIEPHQAIFLDDNEEYTLSAKQLGLKTIWVKSYGQMIKELKDFEINLD